jgi:DNA polymerase III epsilon subunit-like protein
VDGRGPPGGRTRDGLDALRFVVLDTETTGLDPRRDRIITMGAIGFRNGELRLDDVFEACCRWSTTRVRSRYTE